MILKINKLWFGDERGYNATSSHFLSVGCMLWFGDERGYNATAFRARSRETELWFGDERGYNATVEAFLKNQLSCGLVMKEDITQRKSAEIGTQIVVVW